MMKFGKLYHCKGDAFRKPSQENLAGYTHQLADSLNVSMECSVRISFLISSAGSVSTTPCRSSILFIFTIHKWAMYFLNFHQHT